MLTPPASQYVELTCLLWHLALGAPQEFALAGVDTPTAVDLVSPVSILVKLITSGVDPVVPETTVGGVVSVAADDGVAARPAGQAFIRVARSVSACDDGVPALASVDAIGPRPPDD